MATKTKEKAVKPEKAKAEFKAVQTKHGLAYWRAVEGGVEVHFGDEKEVVPYSQESFEKILI